MSCNQEMVVKSIYNTYPLGGGEELTGRWRVDTGRYGTKYLMFEVKCTETITEGMLWWKRSWTEEGTEWICESELYIEYKPIIGEIQECHE